jgi:hypothetical protein
MRLLQFITPFHYSDNQTILASPSKQVLEDENALTNICQARCERASMELARLSKSANWSPFGKSVSIDDCVHKFVEYSNILSSWHILILNIVAVGFML